MWKEELAGKKKLHVFLGQQGEFVDHLEGSSLRLVDVLGTQVALCPLGKAINPPDLVSQPTKQESRC
jgi:hypothetical protein